MTDEPIKSKQALPAKRKKIAIEPVDNLLLTSGSSRRRKAWQRLRKADENRGMTQEQVSKYLESYIKKLYQQVRKEGALTYDKVQRYLDYLAKLGADGLKQIAMDQPKAERFAEKIKPVVEEVGTKAKLTEEDIKNHTREIKQHAAQFVRETEQPGVPAEPVKKADAETASGYSECMDREIVPIGFERGAPKISVTGFLQFPLANSETGPEPGNPYAMHLRYLELAIERSRFAREDLEAVRQFLGDTPVRRYSTYFNIFPENTYDDAALMILFSQWRNRTLERFLIKD